ncbi:Thiaminase-2 (plasmid) [Legionella adelaidensis]|uniref:Thiaminase-2 n=1 Tax=Legionella adelaidensis TaxID=45056 RepID=A0A0W0R0U0_9GAMM|nr:TenA family protein [Legionella adelaidensis]KTC64719.1 Thiaminase-2 [Legionella adelaidensis]VEH82851.1 Thiaminase-2 [Legionella adelaidensis]
MVFSKMLSAITPHLRGQIHNHPFNIALCNGTLPSVVFNKFLEQDRLYLEDFSKALGLIAKRLTKSAHQEVFRHLSLYVRNETPFRPVTTYRPEFFPPRRITIAKSNAINNYTSFLLNTALKAPVEVAAASITPCFFHYKELGEWMNRSVQPDNPYRQWINSYSSPRFIIANQRVIEIMEELGRGLQTEDQNKMVVAFVKATEFEISFWDSLLSHEIQSQVKWATPQI